MLLLNVWVLKQQLIKLLVFFTMEAVWDLSAFLITITVPLVQPLPQNISVAGGAASVTTYDKQVLLKAVLDGDINSRTCLLPQVINWKILIKLIKTWMNASSIKAMIVLD